MQALANFIAEFTTGKDEEEKPMARMIWIDNSSNQRVGGVGILLRSSERDTIECVVRLQTHQWRLQSARRTDERILEHGQKKDKKKILS